MKIVIADDSSLWRDRIRNLIMNIRNGNTIMEAGTGVEAMQIISEKKPDLAILDIRMPEMNGIEVLKRIRELKLKVKVCMLTNYPYPQYKKKCLEEGADYFLDKNSDLSRINEIISGLMGRKNIRKKGNNSGVKYIKRKE